MLARVHPVEDDFWAIRVTLPEDTPGIRAFGAFAGKDEFIALTWGYQEVIDDQFDTEVNEAADSWIDMFGTVEPFSGACLDDYLANFQAV